MSSIFTDIDAETAVLILPELIMLTGVLTMILIPNLGDATMRIPLTTTRVPILFGGTRFATTSNPKMPNQIALATFGLALASAFLFLGDEGDVGNTLHVDAFSRIFTMIFTAALLLVSVATTHRLPARPKVTPPIESDSSARADMKVNALIDNRRQVDFHILLVTTGLGMSLMAMATNLFMLFVCLELASLSSYILVAFHKELDVGGEAGTKYFIVGSVLSAVGIYGMSLLYLWNGNLDMADLAASWDAMETMDPFAAIGVGLMLVAFGFKVGAAPFHLAVPDAYAGASSPVAGLLATASKAMGFVALMRLLLIVTMPVAGGAFWLIVLSIVAVVTMTWGNLAALTSDNPKRMLAYSSVAHAGYMLAALAAIGSGLADSDGTALLIIAVVFHLVVLVLFKLGPFLVLSMLETEGRSHQLECLHGLARRDPAVAASMFVFMLSLAGVPPFSGFLSKLLMINGIVNVSAGTGSLSSTSVMSWTQGVDPIFWLAVAIVLNSALSLVYYLRIGLVMFSEAPESERKLKRTGSLRLAIVGCALLTLLFGIGPMSESLLGIVSAAVDSFMGS